jgi:hypothetical protein
LLKKAVVVWVGDAFRRIETNNQTEKWCFVVSIRPEKAFRATQPPSKKLSGGYIYFFSGKIAFASK